jgi:hypothetical protein
MTETKLPAPVAAFLKATQEHDSDALLSNFSANAVLTDMGKEHRGDEIREWNDKLFIGSNVVVQPINVAERDGKTVVTVVVDGDYEEFGVTGPFQLDWYFSVANGKIASLTMIQEKNPVVAPPVAAYIRATNAFDLNALLATFADDALVNDHQQEFRGKAAIEAWAAREIIGDKVTVYVTNTATHYGDVIVTANVDGNFDKTKLPDPLVLTFYFSVRADKIVQLIILFNK